MTKEATHRPAIEGKETTIPLLPCVSPDETLTFYRALGFETTYEMTKPYLYLALRFRGFELHFGKGPKGLDPKEENSGGCLVLVDAVEPYHRTFTEALRAKYGKVLARGRPRITRFRPGQSRFSLIDPSGNNIIFIQRGEPDLEYGGSKALSGLAKALDNARILRDFKNDDKAAARVLDVALAKYGAEAQVEDRVRAMAARIELSIALNDAASGQALHEQLQALPLSEEERDRLSEELKAAERLEQWLSRAAATRQA
ncbi:glyoxalase [Polyangium jinanense]|uniref:Glyoxalase n=1 Tax=Polyangium jinanense TaxID=2829994 RepID=A0A9X3XFP2_9BACT|nr:glyoxalase [Polyangium jinanense]MDC3962345.1 glyoxalase [Polyangium jinanense]MDC3989142.1 glyoxalase [Polyangium jinanense]